MARGKDRYPPCPWKGHFNQCGKYNAHKSRSVFVVCFFLIFFCHVSLLYLASCTCCAFLCPILPSVLVSSLFRSLNSLFLFEFESACCVAYTARWWHSSLKLLFCIVLGFFLVLFQTVQGETTPKVKAQSFPSRTVRGLRVSRQTTRLPQSHLFLCRVADDVLNQYTPVARV